MVFLLAVGIVVVFAFLNRSSYQQVGSQAGSQDSGALVTTGSPQKTYTISDIASHNSASSCWMAINGTVYDVTSYIDKHPDGPSILKGCGKDATDMYTEVRKHAREGDAMLPTYAIGVFK